MPGPVQLALLPLVQVGYGQVAQQIVQNHAVQIIDQGPAQFTRHDAAHGRLVTGTPTQGEFIGVDIGQHLPDLAHDAAVPVHHRAENVKGQYAGVAVSHRFALSFWFCASIRSRATCQSASLQLRNW